MVWEFSTVKHGCRSLGALPKTCKKLGVVAEFFLNFFFAKSDGRCFTPMIEIKHNNVSLRWNFYADIQLIRGSFWLQLWTLKKFSESRVSWKYLAKMWKKYLRPRFEGVPLGIRYRRWESKWGGYQADKEVRRYLQPSG